jgi:hypothetical protein
MQVCLYMSIGQTTHDIHVRAVAVCFSLHRRTDVGSVIVVGAGIPATGLVRSLPGARKNGGEQSSPPLV